MKCLPPWPGLLGLPALSALSRTAGTAGAVRVAGDIRAASMFPSFLYRMAAVVGESRAYLLFGGFFVSRILYGFERGMHLLGPGRSRLRNDRATTALPLYLSDLLCFCISLFLHFPISLFPCFFVLLMSPFLFFPNFLNSLFLLSSLFLLFISVFFIFVIVSFFFFFFSLFYFYLLLHFFILYFLVSLFLCLKRERAFFVFVTRNLPKPEKMLKVKNCFGVLILAECYIFITLKLTLFRCSNSWKMFIGTGRRSVSFYLRRSILDKLSITTQ